MPTYTDTFTRADSPTLGSIPGSPLTWEVVSGTWSISGNKPVTSTAPASNPIAVVDTGSPDTDVSVAANGGDALYVRVVDAANWLRLRVDRYTLEYEWRQNFRHPQAYLEKCVAGTVTVLDSHEYSTTAPGTIRLRVQGNTLEGFWQGSATPVVVATDATHNTATRHGIGRGPTTINAQALDDFTVKGNTAPNAPTPTTPADGETINRQQDQEFRWLFNDPDVGDSQSAYNFAYRLVGAPSWTETGWVTSTTPKRTVAAGTFAAGDYEWRVFTKDSQGEPSPPSATGFFTAGDPPPGPSLIDPANNATIGSDEYLVEWSAPEQDAYRLRVLDGTVVVYDTGQVDSATARSHVVAFPDNGVTRTIELTVLSGGLWSPASTVTVTVSYTPPALPAVTLYTDPGAGSLSVVTEHPTPTGDQATVTGMDVWVREVGTEGDGLRVAADVPLTQSVRWWLPASGVDYEARVRVIGDNGTSAWSEWSGASAPVSTYYYGGSYA